MNSKYNSLLRQLDTITSLSQSLRQEMLQAYTKVSGKNQILMDRCAGAAQAGNPPQSVRVFSTHEPTANRAIFAGSGMATNRPMSTMMSSNASSVTSGFRDMAAGVFLAAIETYGTDEIIDAVQKDLFVGIDTSMMDIMIRAIATYMGCSGKAKPSDESLKGVIELMSPTTDDSLTEVGNMIRDLCLDGDTLVSFFNDDLTA
ncbi:hypothetical protein NKR23_g12272 [Pleurostoma richardsiae]|uniref:Uncharacterized protein n=1 Tax=Pleurostoma richardsiae TaxID=41990 RepID=A0AA38VAY8_9PEZI|nr:hypothetical protein NKR23_g12272 [Pleurostoma richardsiae]